MNPMQKLLMMVPSPMYRRPPKHLRHEKAEIHQHILDAERQADQLRQPQVQRTDGVVAQARELEHRNADADDDDARDHAKDAPQGDFLAEKIHVQNAFPFLIRILYSTIP